MPQDFSRPVRARQAAPMRQVDAVRALIEERSSPLGDETIATADSVGRVAACDVRATEPFPPFAASTMDGYAVRSQDGAGAFPIQGQSLAGHPALFTQKPGFVSYITTGAPLPKGADGVVPVEDVVPEEDLIRIGSPVAAGSNVRACGSDLEPGELLIPAGTRMSAVGVGLLATAGQMQIKVFRRPRISVLSTGDEVCSPDRTPLFGQIRDSNNPALSQSLLRMGAEVNGGTHVTQDEPAQLRDALAQALEESDLVVSTGGVSMGELDLLPSALKDLGAVLHVERVNMKPGKPFVFATVSRRDNEKLLFALPGNPVSAMVTFVIFVSLAVRRMQGLASWEWPRISVTAAEELRPDASRPEYHRVSIRWDAALHGGIGGYQAYSTGAQASSRLLSMLDADALVEVSPGQEPIPVGTTVPALDLRHL